MVAERLKWNSSRLEQRFTKLNYICAGLIYNVPVEQKIQKVHYWMMKVNIIVIFATTFYFTFFIPFELLSFISTTVPLIMGIAIITLAASIGMNRDESLELYNWIGTVSTRKPYIQSDRFKEEFQRAERYSILIINIITCVFLSAVFILTFVFPFCRFYFLNESFPLPIENVHLPFLPPTNRGFFIINYVHQTYALVCLALFALISDRLYFTFMIHILFYFDAIQALLTNMKEGIETESYDSWTKQITVEFKELRK